MRRLALALTRDAHQADDVSQDAWLRALQHRPWVRDDDVGPWFARVVRNLAHLARCRDARRLEREELAARAEAQPSSAEVLERAELHRTLLAAVMALREPFRESVLLRYLESLPPRAIAQRLGVPVSTVNARIARGLALLRTRIHERPNGSADLRALALLGRPLVPRRLFEGGLLMTSMSKLLGGGLAFVALLLSLSVVPWGDSRVDGLDAQLADDAGAVSAPAAQRPTSERAAASVSSVSAAADGAGIELSTLRGRVLGPADAPLPGIAVALLRPTASGAFLLDTISQPPQRAIDQVTTGADGEFRFEVVAGRPYVLRAPAEADAFYAPIEHGGCFADTFVTLELTRAGVVYGRVLGDDGFGVPAASVSLWDDEDPEALRQVGEAIAGSDGSYRFDGLNHGIYAIEVVTAEHRISERESLVLGRGEAMELDLTLERGFLLTGTVVDARTELPIAGARVAEGWRFQRTATTDGRGNYELRGAGRHTEIYAFAPGFGRTEAMLPTPDDGVAQLDFELTAARSVTGRVLGPDAAPLADVYVAAAGSEHRGNLQCIDWISTTTDAHGRFELLDLRADLRHTLVLCEPGFGRLLHDLHDDESAAATIDVGDLGLLAAAGIRGLVLDSEGRGLAGAELTLRGDYREHETHGLDHYLGRTSWSDASGRFHFTDMSTGEYVVQARLDGRRDEPALSVAVEAGRLEDGVELRFAGGASIAGRALDPRGAPASRLLLFLSGGPAPDTGTLRLRTALDGTFCFSGLQPGVYSLRSARSLAPHRSGGSVRRRLATTLEGIHAGSVDLTLVVPFSAPITGVVRDESGAAAPGSFVLALDVRGNQVGRVQADEAGRFEVDAPQGELVELRGARVVRGPTLGSYRSILEPESQVRLENVRAGSAEVVLRLPPWP